MFSYNIHKEASKQEFVKVCSLIESSVDITKKANILEDVDGTMVQIYHTSSGVIKVYNDYEVDAVYIDSETNLNNIFH